MIDPTTGVMLAGGRATKLRPITNGICKEMLPVGGAPVIGHVVDELSHSVERFVVVLSLTKESIPRYFATAPGPPMSYVFQSESCGPADALTRAMAFVEGPFVMAFPDTIFSPSTSSGPGITERLVSSAVAFDALAVAVEPIPRGGSTFEETVLCHLDASPDEVRADPCALLTTADVTRPSGESTLLCAARWVLDDRIAPYLEQVLPRPDGESYLIDAIAPYVEDGGRIVFVALQPEERRFNIDTWERYASAVEHLGLTEHPASELLRSPYP